MSRVRRAEIAPAYRFPRVSGDEPAPIKTFGGYTEFSPREWG